MAACDFGMRLESDEEEAESCAEKLYMFLYSANAHHRAPELSALFNADFPFESIINSSRDVLADMQNEYAEEYLTNIVILDSEQYVHISDFPNDAVLRRKLNRCLEKLPSFVLRVEDRCPLHAKRCRLLRSNYGFLCYLHLLIDDEPRTVELPSSVAPLEDEGADESEIAIDPEEERALVTVSSEVLSLSPSAVDAGQPSEEGDLPLSCFPSFHIDQVDYVLLTDIMHQFNIREDYCFVAFSQF